MERINLSSVSSRFHAWGAATENALSPNLSITLVKLDDGHSIECTTHADHSIAFNKTTRRPCGTVSLRDERDGAALSRRDVMHFVILWPWPLTFRSDIYWWARHRDRLSLCQVWRFLFQPFWFLSCGQTDTESQTWWLLWRDYRWLDCVAVSKYRMGTQ